MTRVAWVSVGLLATLVLGFAGIRVVTDWPHILAGTRPDIDSFEYRYVVHAVGHAHIAAGIVYLLCAMLQLSRPFRTRHYAAHRRVGRVALVSGLLAGVLAITVGIQMAFGGPVESAAAVVFGIYFLFALVTAFRAIRRGDVATHRRWMIRAFAVAIGVGMIRIWVGLLFAAGMTFEHSFAVAFWVALTLHALAAELYLRRRGAPELAA